MDLHENQQLAVDMMSQVVVGGGSLLIKGKAGTGKSTVVKEGLAAIEGEAGDRDIYATSFTNKAVLRMIEIGFPEKTAMTCHRLLYTTQIFVKAAGIEVDQETARKALKIAARHPIEKAVATIKEAVIIDNDTTMAHEIEKGDEFDRSAPYDELITRFLDAFSVGMFETETRTALKEDYDPSDIIIVDEVGMLPLEMAELIKERYDTVIFMGDHRQLPPIDGPDTINVLETDHTVELTHVFRSAEGSSILDWADLADRDQIGSLPAFQVSTKPELINDNWQVIVYTNKEVYRACVGIRAANGIQGRPQAGERLIAYARITAFNKVHCTREDTEELKKWLRDAERQVNFEIEADASDPKMCYRRYERKIVKNQMFKATGVCFEYEGEPHIGVDLGDGYNWYIPVSPFWRYGPADFDAARKNGMLNCFFAYAVTCHRFQGSEALCVVARLRDRVSEAWRGDATKSDAERPRFNYTAITRAKKDVIVCSSVV